MTGAWQNWGRSESVVPVERARPRSTDEVVAIVRSARDRKLRVKAVGTGHSFTGIAVAPGIQLDMSALAGVTVVDGFDVTMGAGTCLHDLPAALDPLGLALENMGDIDVQTMSGAVSTGTHGTGAKFGGLATRISGATLVTGVGDVLTVNATENAELLPAVSLGLGALGVLTEVTVTCVPSFVLHAVERPEPLDAVLDGWRERVAESDHFEFYWFPAHEGRAHQDQHPPALRRAAGTSRHGEALGRRQPHVEHGLRRNDDFSAGVPAHTPAINRLSTKLTGNREFTDVSYRVFATERRVRFREMEYAIPQDLVPAVLREIAAADRAEGLDDLVPDRGARRRRR